MRQKKNVQTVLAVVLALGVGYWASATAQEDPPRRRFRVGVVDIGRLFLEYTRKDRLEESINRERESMREEVERETEGLRRERQGLEDYEPNSVAWLERRDQIQTAAFSLERKSERLQTVLKKRVEEFTLQILDELEYTIQHYGNRYQYTLILKVDGTQEEGAETDEVSLAAQFQERLFRAQISDVLYFHDAINITDGVLELLNSEAWLEEMERRAAEELERRQESQRAPSGE